MAGRAEYARPVNLEFSDEDAAFITCVLRNITHAMEVS